MTTIAYILFALLLVHFVIILFNFLSKPYLPDAKKLETSQLVSILIPARNEEENLPNLLSDIKRIDYPNIEIIVCNDHSTDKTLEVLKHLRKDFPALTFFTNKPLPDGWVGKNFACHQLAKKAKGQWFLFLDADVRVNPGLVKKVLSYAHTKKTGLLSIFPEQIIGSAGEWKTIPIMNWILLSFLPLRLVEICNQPSLSAANGQIMFFDATLYRKNLWHNTVKNNNVEDISIARKVIASGYTVSVLLGRNDVSCRMYHNYQSAMKGFSLNVHQFFVGSRMWMVLFLLVTWFRLPFYLLSGQYVLLIFSLFLILIMKYMISDLSRFSFKKNMEFHISQLCAFTLMVFYNLKNYYRKQFEWKGRVYKT